MLKAKRFCACGAEAGDLAGVAVARQQCSAAVAWEDGARGSRCNSGCRLPGPTAGVEAPHVRPARNCRCMCHFVHESLCVTVQLCCSWRCSLHAQSMFSCIKTRSSGVQGQRQWVMCEDFRIAGRPASAPRQMAAAGTGGAAAMGRPSRLGRPSVPSSCGRCFPMMAGTLLCW